MACEMENLCTKYLPRLPCQHTIGKRCRNEPMYCNLPPLAVFPSLMIALSRYAGTGPTNKQTHLSSLCMYAIHIQYHIMSSMTVFSTIKWRTLCITKLYHALCNTNIDEIRMKLAIQMNMCQIPFIPHSMWFRIPFLRLVIMSRAVFWKGPLPDIGNSSIVMTALRFNSGYFKLMQ